MTYPTLPPIGQYNWTFDYFYDAKRSPVTASRFQHYPPQRDEMCNDPSLPPGDTNRCDVIFASDGWSYLEFPDIPTCCKCENGFGSTLYNWLQNDSFFSAYTELFGRECEHWIRKGNDVNHYYCEVGTRIPVVYNEYIPVSRDVQGWKQWTFHTDTYNTSVFDEALVSPPPGCTKLCQSKPCIKFRNNGN